MRNKQHTSKKRDKEIEIELLGGVDVVRDLSSHFV